MLKYSFVIPTYCRTEMTDRLVASIVEENLPDSEVLVVDDFTDNGRAEFEAARLPNVRILINDAQRFVAHSRNRGIRESAGEIVVLIDSDVTFSSGQLKGFLSNLGEGFNFPAIEWLDGTDMPFGTSSIFAVERSLLKRYQDDLFDENIGIYGDDNDFFEKGRLLSIDSTFDSDHVFLHGRFPDTMNPKSYSDFKYYMAYRNNLYLSIKYMNLIDDYGPSRFLIRLSKSTALVIINVLSFRFRRAFLIFKGLLWNACKIGACLSARRTLIHHVDLYRQSG